MNKELHTWLSQYISFDTDDYVPNVCDLTVDLFISDICNLKCKHCYYGNTLTIGTQLTTQEWKSIIKSLYIYGVRHFHISGREASLDNRSIEIISYIKNLEGTYTGLVSNGTGQLQFYKSLITEGIDYLEISLDGTEDTHNFIRGKNIYSNVIHLLEALSQYSNIVDISTCLNKYSYNEYFELVETCMSIGIRKFFATSFVLKGNGKSFDYYSITPSSYSQLLENSISFLESKIDHGLILKYCIPHEMTIPMIKNGDFFREQLINYLTGNSGLVHNVKGNLFQISLNLSDIKFLNIMSITSDGEVIPCSDYISYNNYLSYSIGNIKNSDIQTIMQSRLDLISINLKKLKNGNKGNH